MEPASGIFDTVAGIGLQHYEFNSITILGFEPRFGSCGCSLLAMEVSPWHILLAFLRNNNNNDCGQNGPVLITQR